MHALRVNDEFPPVTGEALSGRTIDIPSREPGKGTIVLFSFSKTGGDDARVWTERLDRDADSARRLDIVVVLELQDVPRLLRGAVLFGIKRSVPPSVGSRMLTLDRDDALWRHRLSVTTTDHSYVVLLAPDGRIRWMSTHAYDDDEYAAMLVALHG